MRILALPVLLATVAAAAGSPLIAQSPFVGPSVLDLQGDYHFGSYGPAIAVTTGAIQLAVEEGSLSFTAAQMFSGSLDTWELTASGVVFTPGVATSGDYRVAPTGVLELDHDPSMPGTEVFELFCSTAGDVLHAARYEPDPAAIGMVAVARSSGRSNASMNGTYYHVNHGLGIWNGQLEPFLEWGTAAFDGAGNVTISGIELEVFANGTVLTGSFTSVESYAVAADGALTLDGFPGGLSPDGELFFAVDGASSNQETEMTVGVLQGASYDHADLAGRFSFHRIATEIGTGPGQPFTVSEIGELVLTATSSTTGSWSMVGQEVRGNVSGQVANGLNLNGTTQLATGGLLTLSRPSASDIELVFSANGRYAVGRVDDNSADLLLVVRSCPAEPYGLATAGAGGVAPELGMRTFPTLGNANWRFALTGGLGGAPAILAIGFAPTAAGVPLLGGQLWVDPARIVANPFVVLGGTAGVAGAGGVDVPLPIPSDPSYAGVRFFGQALVLDAQAAGGVSMSGGLGVEFCR
ncbi:MAG: hypothetical protein NXI31_18885 [bacterium]|nr:hypothetical protein [bacterium]